jgi:hypothetical protein
MRLTDLVCIAVLAICACGVVRGQTLRSADAYVKREGSRWTFGTSGMERTVALENGYLVLLSLKNRATGHDLAAGQEAAAVFSLNGEPGPLPSSAPGWTLVDSKQTKLKQGEIQLDITVRRGSLEAVKTWVVYPHSTVVREWVTFKNAGDRPLQISDPSFLDLSARPGGADPDFHWMTGGECVPGSWVLKTEHLTAGKPRTFDSYEPFPTEGPPSYPGDGIDAKITLNDRQVWPSSGWQYVANANVTIPVGLKLDVKAGDRLAFVVNMHHNIGWDMTEFDPTIAYDDGETHTASKEFSGEQGKAGWNYGYVENGKFVELVYYPELKAWRKRPDNATGTPAVYPGRQHPDVGEDAARVWTAPKSGRVRVTTFVCNVGNQGGVGSYGFRMGSGSYAPWNALYSSATKDGIFLGWDYFGHWKSAFTREESGRVDARLLVAGYHRTLAPGESVTTPKAFTGLFHDDLDNAGNECLNWQYRYLWDYTREPWFPAIRMLAYWMKGTGWGQDGVPWTGGNPDWDSCFKKVFRIADFMREVGADVYHRDWGWWDRAGDWNGPDFRTMNGYLGKHGMGLLIYAFLYTVDMQSRIAREHPDWVLGGSTLDMSRPEVVKFMLGQLDEFYRKWGDFEWRNDSTPTCPNGSDDTPLLGQDAGLREVLQTFLDRHPKCAFQGVNGGGNNAGYDYDRFASTIQFSDGAVGVIRNYWTSLLLPPDKTNDQPDIWAPDDYEKAKYRGLLCINFDMTGDTWNPDKLEGVRQLIDIYHYLHKQGVVGRWVQVYRPTVSGDDPTMYFERLSGDHKRAIIIPKHTAPGAVTIKPKGLLPDETYVLSFQEADGHATRTGADLMQSGIEITNMPAGELIYLNLPLHPGSKLDTVAPTPPAAVTKRSAENMGYPGVEIDWKPGHDDNWISYYEVFRDGAPLDKVAHGTYFFDHSAGADPAAKYEVRTVDGAGNASRRVAAKAKTEGSSARVTVVDDAPGASIVYTGEWKHETGLQPAHLGTLSTTDHAGAAAEATVTGKSVLLFSKLGADCGKLSVSVDGGPADIVDTYCADDIWGVCVWRKELASAGRHTIRIEALGQHGPRTHGTAIHIDGIQARPY